MSYLNNSDMIESLLPMEAIAIVYRVTGKIKLREDADEKVHTSKNDDGFITTCTLETQNGDCYTFMYNSKKENIIKVYINDQYYKDYEWNVDKIVESMVK